MGWDYDNSDVHHTLKSIQDIGNSCEQTSKTIKSTIEDLACHKHASEYAKSGGDYETGYKMKQEKIAEWHRKNG